MDRCPALPPAQIVALFAKFRSAEALCPVRFLVQQLEKLRFEFGRPDPALRFFIVTTMLEARVSLETLLAVYADLLDTVDAQRPEQQVLVAWSVVCLLEHVYHAAAPAEPGLGPGGAPSARALALRSMGVSLLKRCPEAMLMALNTRDSRALLAQIRELEAKLPLSGEL